MFDDYSYRQAFQDFGTLGLRESEDERPVRESFLPRDLVAKRAIDTKAQNKTQASLNVTQTTSTRLRPGR